MKKISKFILYLYIGLLILAGVDLILTSFRQNYPWPNLLAANYSMRSYRYLLKDKKFIKGILNSIFIASISSLLSLAMALPLAKKIFYRIRAYKFVGFVISLPFLIAGTSLGLGLLLFFKASGITGSKSLIIVSHCMFIIPYAVRILKPGYSFLKDNLLYAGMMLGADNKALRKEIIFPILAPFIKTALVMGFILSISEYYLTLVLGSGLVESFMTVAFPFFIARDRAISSAISIVFLLINIIFVLVMELVFRLVFRSKKWTL